MLRSVAIMLALGLASATAQAAIIVYTASGTLSNSGGLGLPPFPDGTPISLHISIDASTPDSQPSDPEWGIYAGLTGSFTLGGQTYSIDGYGYRQIEVINDFNYYYGFGDRVLIKLWTSDFSSLDTPLYNGARLHRLTFGLGAVNNDTGVFTGDSLSNTLGLNLLDFSPSFINMQAGDLVYINSDARGPVTALSSMSVIPIPTAAWLFGSALGVTGVMRRKLSS